MITRFAPTPSGYLHEGNAANALLVSWLAARLGARVALRIDDLDAARLRQAYVDDIFETLEWLGVQWDLGPTGPHDPGSGGTPGDRIAHYREALDSAAAAGLQVYACRCSRRMLDGPATGGCPGGCRSAALEFVAGETALRAHVPIGTSITIDDTVIDVADTSGDVVLWRRDDLPAYHLASIVDDRDLAVTHIVRGRDLLEATALQRHLAPFLDAPGVASAVYVHHDLVTDAAGNKLSKSQLDRGAPLARTAAERERIADLARRLGAPVGITPP